MDLHSCRKRNAISADSGSASFDLEAPGSRFSMTLAFAVGLGPKWMERSEGKKNFARTAVVEELGEPWLERDPDLGKVKVLDGSVGRGASGWIPVLEWFGLQAAGG